MWLDIVLLTIVSIVGVVAVATVLLSEDRGLLFVAVVVIWFIAISSVISRLVTRPDHLQAMQSHHALEIANRSLTFLRRGLDENTARAVCHIVLAETEADAVAITDRERVLAFVGVGQDHHAGGSTIMTRATHDAIESNEHGILASKADIGCPRPDCMLNAGIIVPLRIRGEAVGSLKFYYTSSLLLTETQVAMAQGLAELLSRQLELSELDRQTELATRMELKALQAQIHPHFLFNTINTIASLIRTDPPEARRLLREFAIFYRRTLETGDELVPLEQELEYTRRYVGFEKARFGERIRYEEQIDPGASSLRVPAFALQPIVENAVQHGLRADRPLNITLSAHLDPPSLLRIEVRDDGLGIAEEDLGRVLQPGFGKGLGIAMKNVHDRLTGFFGSESGLTIDSRSGEGTCVTLHIAVPATTIDEDGHAQSACSR